MSKNIILIGPSQVGKSTLGNFLLTGSTTYKNPAFTMGDGVHSQTTATGDAECEYEFEDMIISKPSTTASTPPEFAKITTKGNIKILDTPGVGDSRPETETRNMLDVFKRLSRWAKTKAEISCAVLVTRFPTLMDEGYKSNLQFYKKLFPQLFQKNVVLVFTGVSSDKKWISKMERSGKHPLTTIAQMENEIRTFLDLDQKLPSYCVELLADEDEPDYKVLMQARKHIFDRCFKIPGMVLEGVEFPKPIPWCEEDSSRRKLLTGEKNGITTGLEIASSKNAELSSKLTELISSITDLESTRTNQNLLCESLDSTRLVTIVEEQFTDTWHFLWKSQKNFDIDQPYRMVSKVWTGGAAQYDIDEAFHIKGIVWKGWWKELSAGLTVSTYSKLRYAHEIEKLRKDIVDNTVLLDEKNKQKETLQNADNENKKERDRLLNKLKEIEDEIMKLSATHVTLDEMVLRLSL